MMAAAVAQVVVGNNNIQQEVSGSGPMGNMNQIHQNTAAIHNLTERRCSGPDVNSVMPDNKTINTSNDNDLNGNNDSPGSQSEATCNINQNPVDSVRIKNEINDHPSTSRFLSDGISQLTMGSFQVIRKNFGLEFIEVFFILISNLIEICMYIYLSECTFQCYREKSSSIYFITTWGRNDRRQIAEKFTNSKLDQIWPIE